VTHTLAARALELLGPFEGRVAVLGPRPGRVAAALGARVALAGADEPAAAAVVTFLGAGAVPAERQALVASLERRLPSGAPVVLVDHNQPRTWARRLLGIAALVLHGLGPARARYPAARELAALGLEVERLRLVCGERIQLVAARWERGTRASARELVVPAGSK
jgi:hypothetical protein